MARFITPRLDRTSFKLPAFRSHHSGDTQDNSLPAGE
jgi:hypothetical protein